jgi:hypothetical protein
MSLLTNLGTQCASPDSGWGPLPMESAIAGYTHSAVIDWTALTDSTAADAQIFECAIPANCRIADVLLDLKVPFGNTASVANNSTTLTVGDNESATQYVSSQQINGQAGLTYNDGVIAISDGTVTLTSATATFASGDVGDYISNCANLPAGTTTASVATSGGNTVATLTLPDGGSATAGSAQTFTVDRAAGTAAIGLTAMTGSAKTYAATDTLKITLTPASGTALTALNQGRVNIYVRMIQDGFIG